jgi:AraC-like DNA-binding protein
MRAIEFDKIEPQAIMITSWNNKNREQYKLMKKSCTYRLICIEKGELTIKIDGVEHVCVKNDIFYLPPNTIYDTFTGKPDLKILNIAFSFIPTGFTQIEFYPINGNSFLFNTNRWDDIEVIKFKDTNIFNSALHISSSIGTVYLTNTIKTEYTSKKEFYYPYINTLLKELLFKIVRNKTIMEKSNPNEKLDEVFSYIFANITEPLSCARVAKKFNYHPNYLNRLVKSTCGLTLNEYIKDKKLKAAISLLTETDESITYISYHLSFFDNSHFTRFFAAQTGISPSEFRKSFKTNLI